ncbi:hypothetical protein ACGFMM_26520 [Streptomyces sp. NPDC048604]|uniref:hypothetical protein n=1 Tax=Streptomyces sp. NPDC048604 TaxID=3365578 RepID=UPI003710DE88
MSETVRVECPECGRTHPYTPPAYPCVCGSPVVPPLVAAAPGEPVTHRSWADEWVRVRCGACRREADWPRPELGCPCGTVLRVRVRPAAPGQPAPPPEPGPTRRIPRPAPVPEPEAAREPYRPVTIRTARDAVAAAAHYLRWLGFRNVVQPEERLADGVDLRGPGLVAHVDATTRPVELRAVECLWLNGLSTSSAGAVFALAGYAPDARSRAEDVGVALFVIDLTGTPQPLNAHAEELQRP